MRILKRHWMPVALLCMGGLMFVGCQNRRQKTHPYPPAQGFQQTPMRTQPGSPTPQQQLIIPPGNPNGGGNLPSAPGGNVPQGGSTSRYTPGQQSYPGGTAKPLSSYRNVTPTGGSIPTQTPHTIKRPQSGSMSYYKPNQNRPVQSPVGVSPSFQAPTAPIAQPAPNGIRPAPPVPGQFAVPRPVTTTIPDPTSPGGTTVTGPAPSFPGVAPTPVTPSAPTAPTMPDFGPPTLP